MAPEERYGDLVRDLTTLGRAIDPPGSADQVATAVMDRLRQLLVEARHEPKPRRKTKPSKAAKRRRLEVKRKRSEVKSRRRGAGDW